jgi:hypothetical protein
MLSDLLRCLLLFSVITIGLAWPVAARLVFTPAERIVAAVALSLLGVFLFSWLVYVRAWPPELLWLLPLASVAGLAWHRGALAAALRDPDARALLVAQVLVSGWCVVWLATIIIYSGGGWAGDWFEHWERARFFVDRSPLDRMFLGVYSLPARPPLANVITAAFMSLTRPDFPHYQLVTTLLSSLAFLPAALLARRWSDGPGAIAVLAVLFMLNPMFVENATFAWTKLPTAFFVLGALCFFLRTHDADAPRGTGALFAALLAAALLAHYSAGPYAIAFAAAWCALGWARRREARWWRATGLAALVGAAVLATWFSWSIARYGARETFLSNTSVTTADPNQGSQLKKIALNLRDTLVPHFVRRLDTALIAQSSKWGWWRDQFFQGYQLNLFLAFGAVAWLAIARESLAAARAAAPPVRWLWVAAIAAVILLGVAAHGARDAWGLTHIFLQGLVLLGIAFLAARWDLLGRAWQLALVAGATVDFAAGIALHFAVQNFAFDRWLGPKDVLLDTVATLRSYNGQTSMNAIAKAVNHLEFFGDRLGAPGALLVGLLAALLGIALVRTRSPAR